MAMSDVIVPTVAAICLMWIDMCLMSRVHAAGTLMFLFAIRAATFSVTGHETHPAVAVPWQVQFLIAWTCVFWDASSTPTVVLASHAVLLHVAMAFLSDLVLPIC